MPLSSPVLDLLGPPSPSRLEPRPATSLAMRKTMPHHHAATPSALQQQQQQQQQSTSSSSSSSFLPHGMLSGSPFSSGQSSSSDQSSSSSQALDSTFGSTQDNPIILSPDLSPVLPAAASASRPPSPLSILDTLDDGLGADSNAILSSGDGAGGKAAEAGNASHSEMPPATATTSQPLQASSGGGTSFEGAAQSSQAPVQRFAQSFPAYQTPQEAVGSSSIDAQPGQSSSSGQSSTSTLAHPPQASITTGSDDGNLTPAFASARQSQDGSDYDTSDRSARSPQIIAAMEAAEDSSRVHVPRPNAWTEEELDALHSSIAQGQTRRSAYADFLTKFTPSKRSWQAFRQKLQTLTRAARQASEEDGDQDDEDAEDGGDDSDPNELLSEEGEGDEADADVSMTTLSASATSGKVAWSERDERLLQLSVAQNRRGNRIDWLSLVPSFNKASETTRSQSALQTRWHSLVNGDNRAAAPSVALKRKRTQRPSTPAPRPPRLRWTSREHSVLRQILARYPDYASSHLTICDEFRKALPRSERSSVALLKKCRRLVDKYGGRDEEGGSDEEEEETDEEEGDGDRDVAMGEFSVVIPTPPHGTMRTRSGRRLLPLDADDSNIPGGEDQMDDPFIESSSTAIEVNASQQSPQQVAAGPRAPAAEAQQLQPTSAPVSTSTTAHSAAAADTPAAAAALSASSSGAAQASAPPSSTLVAAPATTSAAAPSALVPVSIRIPPNFTFSTTPKGVRITGCFPGLEVVVFAGGHAQFFPHASTVPAAFDQPPLLHLRCLEDGGVEPVTLSQGVAFRTKPVRRRGGGATDGSVVSNGGGGGGDGEMVVQTTFDVGEEYSVVLV